MQLAKALTTEDVETMGGAGYDPVPYNQIILDLRKQGAAGGVITLDASDDKTVTKRRLSKAARSHTGMALRWGRSRKPNELVFRFVPIKPRQGSPNGTVRIKEAAKTATPAS